MQQPSVRKWWQPPLKPLVPRKPWQRFQWRLTVSYLFASILTSVLINLALVAWIIYVLLYSSALLEEITDSLRQGGIEASAFFKQDGVDTADLKQWLDRQSVEVGDGSIGFLRSDEPADKASVAVTDAKGIIIASTPAHSMFPPGQTLVTLLSPEEKTIFAEAQRGKAQTRRSGARFLAAGPVLRQGRVVGVGFLRTGPDFSFGGIVHKFADLMLAGIIYTAFSAAFVGGVFGHVTSQSVTRRLARISQAADRWASGDLEALAPETPSDELGLLGKRLNAMAGDLEHVLMLRRRIVALEERQSLGRDLHDTVKQQAFAESMMIGAAQMHLAAGNVSGAGDVLTEAAALAQQIQTDLADILASRRSESAGDLPASLEHMADDWTRRSGIRVRFENHIPGLQVAEKIGIQVTRIAEEAVVNAVKHSRSQEVYVSLERQVSRIRLMVSDSGIGFDADTLKTQGIGLSTMRERTAFLPKGEFKIISAPHYGTRVIIQFSEQNGKTE